MTDQAECWKDIPGYEGIYKVSDTGLVASCNREISGRKTKGRILKVSTSKSDTSKFNLCTGTRGVSISRTAAYLVLASFIGEPPHGSLSRALHKDGDHKNNRLDNLYWGKHAPNTRERLQAKPSLTATGMDQRIIEGE